MNNAFNSYADLNLHPLLSAPLDFVLDRIEIRLESGVCGAVEIDLLLRNHSNDEMRCLRFTAFRRLDRGDGQFDHVELLQGDLNIFVAEHGGSQWETPGVFVGHLGKWYEGPAEDRLPVVVFWAETVELVE
jgi:hypothetical protein